MDNPKNAFDPYAAPTVNDFSTQSGSAVLDPNYRKMLKDFRSQSLALGVLWLIFAAVVIGLALLVVFNSDEVEGGPVVAGGLALMGVVYTLAGVGTLMKQSWGIYVGLTIAYLSLAGSALRINLCGLIFTIAILIQGHRILKFMKQLKAAGIPLDTKPIPAEKGVVAQSPKNDLQNMFD